MHPERPVPRTAALIGALVLLMAACSGPTPNSSGPSVVASGPPASAATAPQVGLPVGTWVTTITESDLSAAGVTKPGDVTENVGTFTMTLTRDGTWTTTQDTDAPVRWPVFRGTTTATTQGAFEQVTEFPPDFAGDRVAFTWRIEDGELYLTVPDPPDHILPIIMESHPWTPAG